MTTRSFNKKLFKLSLLNVALLTGFSAQAEEAKEDAKGLEVIEVTAQKRVQRLQDVGMSVDALSQNQMKDFGINSASDIVNTMTNVELNSAGGNGNKIITIRGLGLNDFTLNSSPTAAVHVDEGYLGSNAMTGFSVFDLERAEVLKGPQGTLFGQSSTAGVINFITNKPTEDFEGYVTATVGNYQTTNLEGAVGGAIVDGLRTRLAVKAERSGEGHQTNNAPDATFDKNGKIDKFAARLQLGFELGNTEFLLKVHGGADKSEPWLPQAEGMMTYDPDTDSSVACASGQVGRPDPNECFVDGLFGNAWQGITDNDGDVNAGRYNFKPVADDEFIGGSIRIDHDFGFANFTSLTTTEKFNYRHKTDLDGIGNEINLQVVGDFLDSIYTAPIADGGFGFEEAPLQLNDNWQNTSIINQYEDFEIKQFNQEFRLTSPGGERFNWLVGAYLSQEDIVNSTGYETPQFTLFAMMPWTEELAGTGLEGYWADFTDPDGVFYHDFDQQNKSYAVFAQTDYALIEDTLKLNFGLRYSKDEKTFSNETYGVDGQGVRKVKMTPEAFIGQPDNTERLHQSADFSHLAWNVGLDYNIHSDLMFYTRVANGYKSGGFPGALPLADVDSLPYNKETIMSYEAGLKGITLDNTLQFTAAAFMYDYKDMQGVYATAEGFDVLSRIGDAKISGIELDGVYQIIEGLTVRGALGTLSTEITNGIDNYADTYGNAVDITGNKLSHAPELTANGHIRYEADITENVYMAAQLDASYKSDFYLRYGNHPSDKWDQNTTIIGARLMVADMYDKWNVAIWGRNLTNEVVPSYQSFSLAKPDHFVFYNMPRTFGIDFTYRFGE
ncbi:TonB-dependent receptor [Paraferrimonas sp. SM1919]|uniref:TonB-dependent receptor n=1 Tax=Paraferrimonas sp. SM1919 TaxID=2662263 RepID=UPI0013CF55F1|nr:TonB-dependent receptor plug domain-containing protein [Paraferrimonas sp. SM1919]